VIFRFYNDEWELFIQNCGFTDIELEIIPLIRRGWAQIDIAAELCISLRTFARHKKRIEDKIIHYISKQTA
jgi:DNA-binding NarL/FixJ family response regulator